MGGRRFLRGVEEPPLVWNIHLLFFFFFKRGRVEVFDALRLRLVMPRLVLCVGFSCDGTTAMFIDDSMTF